MLEGLLLLENFKFMRGEIKVGFPPVLKVDLPFQTTNAPLV